MPYRSLAFALTLLSVTAFAPPALAEPPPAALMEKLATYAASFDRQRTHASYRLDGWMDVLDGDESVTERKELAAQVDATGDDPKVTVLHYAEDGRDKTADAIKDARERDEKHRKRKHDGKELKMPILADQQPRYVFDETEQSADGSRVLVHFAPRTPAEDTVEGSAWVDATAGTIISASFKLSKTSLFVDYIHVRVEFGAQTSLGPAVSRVSVDGEGGILFFHRHFRGTATLSDYAITP